MGPVMTYQADASLKGTLPKSIRLGTYNILNLYDHAQPHAETPHFPAEKGADRIFGNARAIRDIDPDFQVVVEVENMAALKRFNEEHLDHQYEPILVSGNDARVEIAMLVKRDLAINFEWRSFKKLKNGEGQNVFTRDLPVGLVFERDANGKSLHHPKLAILATHYKSQRTKRDQPDTAIKRQEQVIATIKIVTFLQQKYGKNFPIFLAGDFNNNIHVAPEFKSLFKFGFKDTLDMLAQPPKDRTTHYFFRKDGVPPEETQLDGILSFGSGVRVLEGRIIPDRDANDNPLPAPKTFEERESRPSDHRPIGVTLEVP